MRKRRKLTVLGRFVVIIFIGVLFGASLGFYYRFTNDSVKKDDLKEQKQEEEVASKKQLILLAELINDKLKSISKL